MNNTKLDPCCQEFFEWCERLKKALRRLVNVVNLHPELAEEAGPAMKAAENLLTEYYHGKPLEPETLNK